MDGDEHFLYTSGKRLSVTCFLGSFSEFDSIAQAHKVSWGKALHLLWTWVSRGTHKMSIILENASSLLFKYCQSSAATVSSSSI